MKSLARRVAAHGARASAETVASTDSTVLITGETGTGMRCRLPARFIILSCGANANVCEGQLALRFLPACWNLELFGHERGAFTGAITQRAGIGRNRAG